MPDFRRGTSAIEESKAAAAAKGGNFKPFAPFISWREDKEEKYIIFLNPAEEFPTVLLHEYVPVGTGERQDGSEYTKYETFISRKDPAIGEEYDDLTDRLEWSTTPERTFGVAVELEPIIEKVGKRQKPKGFKVKTATFDRRIRDADDDLTDETEEVTAPVVGLVVQSPSNFYSWIGSYHENDAAVEETPLKVVRDGKGTDTKYHFTPYEGQPVDLTALVENLEGITYLGEDQEKRDEFIDEVSALDTDEAARRVGERILETRLDELADIDRYKALVGPLTEISSPYDKKKNNKGKGKGRTPRQSQRQRKASSNEEKEDKFDKLKGEVEGKDE